MQISLNSQTSSWNSKIRSLEEKLCMAFLLFLLLKQYVEDFTLNHLLRFEICAVRYVKKLFTNIQKQ